MHVNVLCMEQDNVAYRLGEKLKLLISRYEALKQENAEMSAELASCREQLKNDKNKIDKLEEQIGNLQLKEAFMGATEEKAKARKRVASLIKEIDECIGMLNG